MVFEVFCFVLVREGQSLSSALSGYRYKNKRRTGHASNFSPSIVIFLLYTLKQSKKSCVEVVGFIC